MADSTATSDAAPDRGSGLLAVLMAPLRVPGRALEALAGAVDVLADIRTELTAVREQTEPLAELVPLTKEIKVQVEPMPATVARISTQAEPLDALLPALDRLQHALVQRLAAVQETMEALERHETVLNDNVEKLGGEIVALHGTVEGLKEDVERITERLPDAAHGPLEKARDFLTGSGDSGTGDGN
ncbi:MAG: hypothetical protein M3406_03330 [Chloroflexota bacterium]|nr:hypothetical protein [Chloroflexota bacterium]